MARTPICAVGAQEYRQHLRPRQGIVSLTLRLGLRLIDLVRSRDFGRSVSMHFAPPEGLRFFARYGWKVGQFLSVGAIARRIGRSPSFFRTVRWMLKMFFMSRRRRAAMRQMIGYARLDRA